MLHRLAILGLDCLTPQLWFEDYLSDLPTVQKLMHQGPWGPLKSTVPPITIPAWLCMSTSQDPGQLGLYGFRNRRDHSYADMAVADATWLKKPTLWQLLSRRRRPSLVVGVPLTYPPRPILGNLVSGVPVPADAEQISAPASLRAELDAISGPGGYTVDVGNFRKAAPEQLLRELEALRDQRFQVLEELARRKDWDLLFGVDMSVDRLHHSLWAHAHPDHPLHDPDTKLRDHLRRFYIDLDRRVAGFIEAMGEDTGVLIVSDHGAKTMRGGLRINEWLIRQGLLRLKARPQQSGRLRPDDIDWQHTKVWAEGGYYSRVFVNVRGREPQGQVEDLSGFVQELKQRMEDMDGPDGQKLGNRVFVPQQTYKDCKNVAPDLIVYPGDLDYRANAQVLSQAELSDDAQSNLFTLENDTGVDGANHAQHGIWMYRPARGQNCAGARVEASIYDVAPTALSLLGEKIPAHMIGQPIAQALGQK